MATLITTVQQITPQLLAQAEVIFDRYFAGCTRIDWDDLLYRLEERADIDLGASMAVPHIDAIKAHLRRRQKEKAF